MMLGMNIDDRMAETVSSLKIILIDKYLMKYFRDRVSQKYPHVILLESVET